MLVLPSREVFAGFCGPMLTVRVGEVDFVVRDVVALGRLPMEITKVVSKVRLLDRPA